MPGLRALIAVADRQARTEPRDSAENTEPTQPAEQTEKAEAIEPTEPIEAIEPADPIEPIDPADPMDKMDPHDPIDKMDPRDPMDKMDPLGPVLPAGLARSACDEPVLVTMPAFSQYGQRRAARGPACAPARCYFGVVLHQYHALVGDIAGCYGCPFDRTSRRAALASANGRGSAIVASMP